MDTWTVSWLGKLSWCTSLIISHLSTLGDEAAEAAPAADEAQEKPAEETPAEETPAEAEEVDIDLNDPEVAKAATTIQASFRGHQIRKQMKEGEGEPEKTEQEEPAEEKAEEPAEAQGEEAS